MAEQPFAVPDQDGLTDYAAVLGHPVGHSLSPALHTAALAACGLRGWAYGRHDVVARDLAGVLETAAADGRVRGFSCTMPLKEELVALAAANRWEIDDTAALTGAANTWVDDPAGPRILNTDVTGIVGALLEAGAAALHTDVVGTGATARSAVVAAVRSGAESIRVHGRNPEKARAVAELAEGLGARASTHPVAALVPGAAELLISTVPAGVVGPDTWDWPAALPAGAVVLDVSYAPGGFDLGSAFRRLGGRSILGTRMLVHQAVDQFREFAAAAGLARPGRDTVRGAMDLTLAESGR